jgi:hypothetical protein
VDVRAAWLAVVLVRAAVPAPVPVVDRAAAIVPIMAIYLPLAADLAQAVECGPAEILQAAARGQAPVLDRAARDVLAVIWLAAVAPVAGRPRVNWTVFSDCQGREVVAAVSIGPPGGLAEVVAARLQTFCTIDPRRDRPADPISATSPAAAIDPDVLALVVMGSVLADPVRMAVAFSDPRDPAKAVAVFVPIVRDVPARMEVAFVPIVQADLVRMAAAFGLIGQGVRVDGGGIRPDRPNRPGGGDWADHRPGHIDNWNQWNDWRHNHRDNVWNHWHNHWHDHGDWYGRDWWNRYPNVGWRYPANFNFWGYAAWPAVAGWFPWDWSQPVYYSYGDNVYYEGDQVYYGDQPVATADQYADQAEAIATSVPDVPLDNQQWMPLGVFAVTPDGEPSGAEPTLYLQLAVSKDGIISGTLQNTATDKVQPIEGMVDKQTQRAAWTVQGQTRPIMETGIVNLTEDTSPALVHFADGSTQQWLLVRLDKPPAEGAATTPG